MRYGTNIWSVFAINTTHATWNNGSTWQFHPWPRRETKGVCYDLIEKYLPCGPPRYFPLTVGYSYQIRGHFHVIKSEHRATEVLEMWLRRAVWHSLESDPREVANHWFGVFSSPGEIVRHVGSQRPATEMYEIHRQHHDKTTLAYDNISICVLHGKTYMFAIVWCSNRFIDSGWNMRTGADKHISIHRLELRLASRLVLDVALRVSNRLQFSDNLEKRHTYISYRPLFQYTMMHWVVQVKDTNRFRMYCTFLKL